MIIAQEVAETLYRFENPIGKTIHINVNPYRIVGVTRFRTASAAIGGSLSGQDFNKDVYIPLKTLSTYIMPNDLDIQRGSGSVSAEKVELNQITLQVASRKDVIPTADVVRESLEINHPDLNDVAVIVPLELLKQADQIKLIFNIVLGSIAAISLLVGGIGIMNIMLATVTERTREIGIRRALGAKQRDITQQFLTETIVLSGTGGLLGVGFGFLCGPVVSGTKWLMNLLLPDMLAVLPKNIQELEPRIYMLSVVFAFAISVGVGVVFGIYPAIRAAYMDPIEALRHE